MTKQYNLVPTKGRWCSATGKVTAGLAESNGSLPPGGLLLVHRDQLQVQRSVTSMGSLLPFTVGASAVRGDLRCTITMLIRDSAVADKPVRRVVNKGTRLVSAFWQTLPISVSCCIVTADGWCSFMWMCAEYYDIQQVFHQWNGLRWRVWWAWRTSRRDWGTVTQFSW